MQGLSEKKVIENAQLYLLNVFKWLRKKDVKRIVKVVVRDNMLRSCSDETIEKALKGFDIRYLDWDKPDICCETIRAVAPDVVELWLNASGNNAVLWGWSDDGGLKTLTKVPFPRRPNVNVRVL